MTPAAADRGAPRGAPGRARIVLDTDIGTNPDDALALALALRAPELELLAVTAVGSESLQRARIAARLLALAGREDVPVHAGCRVPLLGGEGFRWFGHEGEGVLEPGEEPPVSALHAVDALRALLRGQDGVHVVAIGPLTNLAAALILEPDLAARIASLTAMGGQLREPGPGGAQLEPGADYNFGADPHAAHVVLRSGIPIRLLPIEVTRSTWIGAADVERIAAAGTPLAAALAAQLRFWTPLQRRMDERRGGSPAADRAAFLHDPLALACAYDESFCRFETLEIEPVLEGGLLLTRERARASGATRPLRCALEVDAARFREHVLARLCAAGEALSPGRRLRRGSGGAP